MSRCAGVSQAEDGLLYDLVMKTCQQVSPSGASINPFSSQRRGSTRTVIILLLVEGQCLADGKLYRRSPGRMSMSQEPEAHPP